MSAVVQTLDDDSDNSRESSEKLNERTLEGTEGREPSEKTEDALIKGLWSCVPDWRGDSIRSV